MNEPELKAGLSATQNYRYADRVGRQLFVAGQVPLDAQGNLVGSGCSSAQAFQCLRNLDVLIQLHQFEVADIRQIVVYVVGDQKALTEAWAAVVNWFAGEVPPATLLGVVALGHEGQRVEIDATVIKSHSHDQGG
jgi:enamine deaminase RidA (YjgF/YER057c/UK114 family)